MMKLERLGNICDLQNGYAFKSSDYIDESNTLCCRMSNIRPDSKFDIDYNPKYLPDAFKDKYKDFLLKDGDIIIAMTDMATDPKILGVPTQVETKGHTLLLNQRVGKLFNFNLDKVSLPYIKVALGRKELKDYYKKFSGGGIQLNISKENILNIKIPLPPLPDQIRIASILSQAEALIAERKQSISLLDELLKSTFLEMFGDPVKNEKGWEKDVIKNLLSRPSINGHYVPKEQYIFNGTEMVHMSDLFNDIVPRGKLKRVNIPETEIKKYELTEFDILIARRSLTPEGAAKACLIPKSNEPLVFESSMIRLTPNIKKILPIYLFYYLNNDRAKSNYVLKHITKSTISGINQSNLNKIEVITPPIELQTKFAAFVEKVKALKTQYQQSLTELQNMYGVLSQKAFKGELSLDKVKTKA